MRPERLTRTIAGFVEECWEAPPRSESRPAAKRATARRAASA